LWLCFQAHYLEDFMAEVRKVFDSPVSGREAASKLLEFCQNSSSVADYAVDFVADYAVDCPGTCWTFLGALKPSQQFNRSL
jgi:hypothetical protein